MKQLRDSVLEARYFATLGEDLTLMTEIWTHYGWDLTRLILSERIEPMEEVKGICQVLLLEKLRDHS